jgi:hypothetical protein
MAMAMHSSLIASRIVTRFCRDRSYSRSQMEHDYRREWMRHFRMRLWTGRQIQNLFGSERTSGLAVMLLKNRMIANAIIRNTHGEPFR